jgi:hypothetical protein
MDEQQQATTIWQLGLWDAVGWLITLLVTGLLAMMKRSWRQLETRQDALEEFCKVEHKQRMADLTQHAVADSRTHDDIRRELADELKQVNAKIDGNNDKSVTRFEALSLQMTTQHEAITARVDRVLELMRGGRT